MNPLDSSPLCYVCIDSIVLETTHHAFVDFPGVRIIADDYKKTSLLDHELLLEFKNREWLFRLPSTTTTVKIGFNHIVSSRRLSLSSRSTELVVKAILGKRSSKVKVSVVDATAGLGRDGLLLAAAGCKVTMIERIPLLAYLLNDSIVTAKTLSEPDTALAASRMSCLSGYANNVFSRWQQDRPMVVYLDPMYNENESANLKGLKPTAAVKKQTQLLHCLNQNFLAWSEQQIAKTTLESLDAHTDVKLLLAALNFAQQKVVVKRAPKSPWLAELKPSSSLHGKAVRFDIYAC